METIKVLVSMGKSLCDKLDQAAENLGMTRSAFIQHCILEELKKLNMV